jgi:hypothetical protein
MHYNEFRTLNGPFGGLEMDFDLGYKFEEKESDACSINSETGVKAYAEPFLALYVSARRKSSEGESRTLHYALPRSSFKGGLHPNESDRQRLVEGASHFIVEDLRDLLSNKNPQSLQRFRMIC